MIIYYPSPFHVDHSPEVADKMCKEFDYEALKKGLKDSAEGKVSSRGSFAQYIDPTDV